MSDNNKTATVELEQWQKNERVFAADAMREYKNVYKEVENLMADARQLIDEHAARVIADAATAPVWESTGDIKHVRNLVRQLVAFLEDSE